MKINIFNTELTLRDNYCALNEECPSKIESPYINLYVRFSGCNANCPFCEFKTCNRFNEQKYRTVINELVENVEVRKISYTGGEPTLSSHLRDIHFLNKVMFPNSFYVLNTNGTSLSFDSLILNSVSISRHHYDQDKNNAFFGAETFSLSHIKERDNGNIHLSCTLTKGGIDSAEEVEKYIQEASSYGFHDIGFVTLMKVNKWAEEHYVPFPENVPNLFKSMSWNDRDRCSCNNYLYANAKNPMKPTMVYNRGVAKNDCFESMLTFDGENLRVGYNGRILF